MTTSLVKTGLHPPFETSCRPILNLLQAAVNDRRLTHVMNQTLPQMFTESSLSLWFN